MVWCLTIRGHFSSAEDIFIFKGDKIPEELVSSIELWYEDSHHIIEALREWNGSAINQGFVTKDYSLVIRQTKVYEHLLKTCEANALGISNCSCPECKPD